MSWDNKNLRCHDCRFWWLVAESSGGEPRREHSILGQCRRHAPPVLIVDLPEHTRRYPSWASTKRDDWCGEHQHREM